MKCQNKFCVYHNKNQCTKENIEVDWRGFCSSSVSIRLTQDTINYSKMYTKLLLKNDDYYFDKDIGEFVHLCSENNL